jgi:hypothetical protein
MKKNEVMRIDAEGYPDVLAMLNSSNSEDNIMGLTLVENADFKSSITFILLLRKDCTKLNGSVWEAQAPSTAVKMKALGIDMKAVLKWGVIFKIIKQKRVPLDHLQFFMDQYAEFVKTNLNEGYGTDFLEEVNIVMTLKKEHAYEPEPI